MIRLRAYTPTCKLSLAWQLAGVSNRTMNSPHFVSVLVLLLFSVGFGQEMSSGSGDGDDGAMDEQDPNQARVDFACALYPQYCERSSQVCPCGSFRETAFSPNYFHLVNMYPCPAVPRDNATVRECDVFIELGALQALHVFRHRTELEYLNLYCFTISPDVSQAVSKKHISAIIGLKSEV